MNNNKLVPSYLLWDQDFINEFKIACSNKNLSMNSAFRLFIMDYINRHYEKIKNNLKHNK